MNTPSIKALRRAFPHLKRGQATQIKRIMDSPPVKVGGLSRLERIDEILGTYGVEYIRAGHNAKSPSITYCNTGDTYETTILKLGGHFDGAFRIGCWGDIVERGNYD